MAKFLLYLLLYLVVVSTVIAMFAAGLMGASIPYATVNYTPPDNESITREIPIVGSVVTAGGFASAFIHAIFDLLFWNLPAEILPVWANIILIKIPLLILIVAVVEVLLP